MCAEIALIVFSVSQKKADMLNLHMNEVTVTGLQGDQKYQCVLEKIEYNAVICKIKGEPGAITVVDSLIVSMFYFLIATVMLNLKRLS